MTDVRPSELLVKQRVSALTRALPDAQSGKVEGIHEARVSSRRLRELLPLVTHGAKGQKLTKQARRLTRALGPVRELDVVLMTLDELPKGASLNSGIERLRHIIGEERTRLFAHMTHEIERVDAERLSRKTIAAARRRDKHPGHSGPGDSKPLARAANRAAKRATALVAAIDNAGGIYLSDRLHQVRIAVKKLRYAMEIERELRGSRATARIRTLKDVQDLLGRMHDLEVLITRIRALQGSALAPELKVSAELDQLVRRLETECRQLHVGYMGFKKKLLAVCDYVTAADDRRATAA